VKVVIVYLHGKRIGEKLFNYMFLYIRMDPIVILKRVHKTFLLGRRAVPALRGVNLDVERGEFLAIMGPSGCGKTTLLNLVGMLDKPTEGRVVVKGRDATSMSDDLASDLRLREVGFVFQNFNLIPNMTVLENVQLPMRFAYMNRIRMESRARMLLNAVGLEDRMEHLPSELSGGEQQRVSIARALANDPSILILDEPTGELDSEMGHEIISLLKRLNKKSKKTMIMASHDPSIASYADRVVRMLDGKVVG